MELLPVTYGTWQRTCLFHAFNGVGRRGTRASSCAGCPVFLRQRNFALAHTRVYFARPTSAIAKIRETARSLAQATSHATA